MKIVGFVVVGVMMAAPAFAQVERGYVEGIGGFDVSSVPAASSSLTSGNGGAQVSLRIVKRVMAFGELGRFQDLQPQSEQTTVDSTVAALSTTAGLNVIGTTKMPATYGLGGIRFEGPTRGRVTPYVLGGIGVARLSPTVQFAYSDGVLPNADPTASAPPVGQDVTTQIVSAGDFALPSPTSAFMFSAGAGASFNVAKRWALDAGYRFSRISSDAPIHAQGLTFGMGYRF